MGRVSLHQDRDTHPACLLGFPTGLEREVQLSTMVEVHAGHVCHPDHPADLLAPSFPDAQCRDRVELFDRTAGHARSAEVEYARVQALALCASCPCLRQCRAWFDSLPASKRPPGVVAGRVVNKRSAHTPW